MERMSNPKVVYLVKWFGRGHIILSQNITTDRRGIQKYIDRIIKIAEADKHVQLEGDSPDRFSCIDRNDDNSGIHICSLPIINKFENIDFVCRNVW